MHTIRFYLLFCLLVLIFHQPLAAQDFPYSLQAEREIGLLSLGGGMMGAGYLLETRVGELDDDELGRSVPEDFFFLDRPALEQRSESYRTFSDKLLRGSLLLPATHLLGKAGRRKAGVLGVMALETVLLTEGTTKILKILVRRRRPLSYNPEFPLELRADHDARQSFPSGHTSNTAALSFFTAKVFHDLYPDSKLRPFVWAGAAVVPALTGYARFRAGKHFPTDIIAGYALGATLGILVPEWHKGAGRRLRAAPTGNGISLVYALH